jgi:quercetin dioxygenase-like cupin family protein
MKIAIAFATLTFTVTVVGAQTNPIKRTDLQQIDHPDGYTTLMAIVEIAPNHAVPAHTHPGAEVVYVMEGEMTITLAGKQPLKVKAGDSLAIPANTVHHGTMGPAGVKLLNTYVLEKGKPMSSPASP